MPFKTVILSLIVTIAFCIVSCSTFIHFEMNDNYFQLLPMSVGVGIVAAIAFLSCVVKRNHSFHFTLPDALLCVIVAYYVIRYDYQFQLANWKIINAVLLLFLWFATRIILSNLSISKSILLGGFVGIGCALAIWGLLQLYGFQESNHSIFSITGPFHNPGPYSGYIAMLTPICFSQLLSARGKKRYIWLLAFSTMIIILPAGMSRSAWLALLIGCTWLLIIQKGWFNKIKSYTESQPKRMFSLSFLSICLLLTIAFFIFQLKADSANGRLFIWKNTCRAIQEQPLLGYGPGSFSTIYGKTQATYFSSANYSPEEAHIAGTPEYAFNECLQACIEGGIPLLLLFSAFLITSFYKGIRNKEYASCAGLLSLFIFSLFSYSLQILPFGIMGVLLLATCISTNEIVSHTEKRKTHTTILSICVLLASIGFSYSLWHVKEVAEKWNQSNTLRVQKVFKEASVGYKELYKEMKYNINFLLNYAQILSAQKKYSEACEVLEQAKRVSCDVTIWNVQGRNYQLAGHYTTAETCFKESLNLLPTRLYPYYLLAKLYTEPTFFDREKAKKMAIIVLTKPPKVHSKATDEMKTEMKTLLNRLLHNY